MLKRLSSLCTSAFLGSVLLLASCSSEPRQEDMPKGAPPVLVPDASPTYIFNQGDKAFYVYYPHKFSNVPVVVVQEGSKPRHATLEEHKVCMKLVHDEETKFARSVQGGMK